MKIHPFSLLLLLFYFLSLPDCFFQQIFESNVRNIFYQNDDVTPSYGVGETAGLSNGDPHHTTLRPRPTRRRRRTTTPSSKMVTLPRDIDHSLIHVDDEHLAPNWSAPGHVKFRPNEYRLVRHLLQYYDRRVRPVQPKSKSLNITFGIAISQIIDVDEKNQLITTNCWLSTMWVDFQLTWNPHEWNQVKTLRIPYSLVWLPDIMLYNSADMMTYFSAVSTNVIADYTGNVTWLSMMIYKSTCSIDVRYFPFDVQNCSLLFSSWTYDGTQMGMESISGEEGDVSNYIENTEWSLQNFTRKQDIKYFSCCPNEPYPFITYFLVIRRRPLYYVYNLFMPCILITLIALLGFCVPSDSGEKVSMGITTLLSMTVFLMVVAESMPPTKTHVPLLGLYFGFTIIVVSCTTGLTVLTLNIHHSGKKGIRMPKFLRFVIFKILARIVFQTVNENEKDDLLLPKIDLLSTVSKCFCKTESSEASDELTNEQLSSAPERTRSESTTTNISGGNLTCLHDDKMQKTKTKEIDSLAKDVKRLADVSERQRASLLAKEVIENEWHQASDIIDRLNLIVFVSATVAVTILITLYAES